MTKRQLPSISDQVHYVSYGSPGGEYASQCRAATVTAVGAWVDIEAIPVQQVGVAVSMRRMLQHWYPNALGLFVMNPNGTAIHDKVLHDPGSHCEETSEHPAGFVRLGGTWHYADQCAADASETGEQG